MFLKISPYSQENTWVGVYFFKKVAGLKVAVSVDNGPHLSDQRIFWNMKFVNEYTFQWRRNCRRLTRYYLYSNLESYFQVISRVLNSSGSSHILKRNSFLVGKCRWEGREKWKFTWETFQRLSYWYISVSNSYDCCIYPFQATGHFLYLYLSDFLMFSVNMERDQWHETG